MDGQKFPDGYRGYSILRVNFTECLYEETLSLLAGCHSFAPSESTHVKAFPRSCHDKNCFTP